MKQDATHINQSYDLLSLVEQDTTLRKSGGGWWAGPCPFCGGEDRFVVKQTGEGFLWLCRGCGDDKYHTPIDYVMQRQELDFVGALAWMNGGAAHLAGRAHTPAVKVCAPTKEDDSPIPSEAWRARGMAYIATCEAVLWSDAGVRALAYLHGRALSDDTLKQYHIGYNPVDVFESLPDWGLSEPEDGKRHAVWLPRGITIPCIVGNELYYIKTRRPVTHTQEATGEQKYIKVKGSEPGLFGADNLRGCWLAVLTEGEFDSLLLNQEAGDLAGIATLGSASDRATRLDMAIWGRYFLSAAHILAAYDLDTAGEKGVRGLEAFSSRVKHAPLPAMANGKDITDYWKAGGDLGDWLARTVERLGLLPTGAVDVGGHLLNQAERAFDIGDHARGARLFAHGAQMAGAMDPFIPWPEWIENMSGCTR